MFRVLSITITLAAIISMSGCVLGPSCGGGNCNSCDGYGDCGRVGMGPGESFRQWRRSLTCGSGCGETYYDEWYSSPPDCEDPCPQFGVCGSCGGGCVGCLDGGCSAECGGCGRGVQPLRTIAGLAVGLYGKRFCNDCGYGVDDCCCDVGGGCASGGCGGEIISGGSAIQGGGCANGSCSIKRSSPTQTRTASRGAARSTSMGGTRVTNTRARARMSPAHQQAMARQQTAPMTSRNESQVVYPVEQNPKFYRQATRLPQGQPAFRR